MTKVISFIGAIFISVIYVSIFVIADEQANMPGKSRNWQVVTYPVTTPLQKEYDAEDNNLLEPNETKEYLKERYRMIEYGNTGVDSDILREYDADNNGVIDPREAQDIRDDISE